MLFPFTLSVFPAWNAAYMAGSAGPLGIVTNLISPPSNLVLNSNICSHTQIISLKELNYNRYIPGLFSNCTFGLSPLPACSSLKVGALDVLYIAGAPGISILPGTWKMKCLNIWVCLFVLFWGWWLEYISLLIYYLMNYLSSKPNSTVISCVVPILISK